jgi:hypothetical protein
VSKMYVVSTHHASAVLIVLVLFVSGCRHHSGAISGGTIRGNVNSGGPMHVGGPSVPRQHVGPTPPNEASPAMPYEGDLQPPTIDTGVESAPEPRTPVTDSFNANGVQPLTNRYLPASYHQRKPAATSSGLYGPLGYDPL